MARGERKERRGGGDPRERPECTSTGGEGRCGARRGRHGRRAPPLCLHVRLERVVLQQREIGDENNGAGRLAHVLLVQHLGEVAARRA
eukprot:5645884-Prymnesium_polylepis.1